VDSRFQNTRRAFRTPDPTAGRAAYIRRIAIVRRPACIPSQPEEIFMHLKLLLSALFLVLLANTAQAQLKPFTDYDISDAVWNITTVKVHPNMGNEYLEGLRDTWVAANRVAKELGQIEDFFIFQSEVGGSGDANLFLVIKYPNSDSLKPSKTEYDRFMEAWGNANQDKTREITKDYSSMRDITGEYLVRRIDVK
jgi:hypothetical protein